MVIKENPGVRVHPRQRATMPSIHLLPNALPTFHFAYPAELAREMRDKGIEYSSYARQDAPVEFDKFIKTHADHIWEDGAMLGVTYPIQGDSVFEVSHVITLFADKSSGDEYPHGILMISKPKPNTSVKTPPFFNFFVVYVELEERRHGLGTLLVKMGNALAKHVFVHDAELRAEIPSSQRAIYTVMYFPVSDEKDEDFAYFKRQVSFGHSLGFVASNATFGFFGADTETEVAYYYCIDLADELPPTPKRRCVRLTDEPSASLTSSD